jgi:Mn-dependent DtxR family transcriptional regulator
METPPNAAVVWKTFDENAVTHSSAHHLMAIHELLEHNGYARVTDVAKHLGITRGSASVTLKALKSKGFVIEDENKFLRLSPAGRQTAELVAANRQVLRKFLRDVLALTPEQAEIDACKIEHLLSAESGQRLLHFLDFLFSEDQHAGQFLTRFKGAERRHHNNNSEQQQ